MTIEFYSSPAERITLKTAAILRRESTIHDDFIDINGDPTDGNSGRLEFGIISKPLPDLDRDRVIELFEKFETDGTLSLTELIEFVKLKLVKNK